MNTLTQVELNEVNGGFVCLGLCVAGAFVAGAALGYIVVDWAMN
ncbi:class IIb bacteriocin, lactobin A/cerein 7B family [Aliiglaciecola litoralis]|uniref:Class IIb bacteriocin, lactobin A/cerein 7B family n=1 Tax=Aliiglaciecola litoralis TaxID=582857 RepID=A0ABN1LF99_9ALTE